jgi:hypothetical protein
MTEEEVKVYESGPEQPDDDFWLGHGKKMVEESLPAVRDAAKSLMTGLGLLQGIYLAILGFSDFLAKSMSREVKFLFIAPLLLWLGAVYNCLHVMMTQRLDINLSSPDDIREQSRSQLIAKQKSLRWAFGLLAAGLVVALKLIIYRLKF